MTLVKPDFVNPDPIKTMPLVNEDIAKISIRLPKFVKALMFENKLMLAGGFIRATIAGEEPSDIDLFGGDLKQLEKLFGIVSKLREVKRTHETENAYTIFTRSTPPIQIIKRWTFTDPIRLIESFDFTIARSVVWYDELAKLQSACDQRFYPDLAGKRLVYEWPDRMEEPGGSMLRVRKFLQRGYSISVKNLAAVMARVMNDIDPEQFTALLDNETVGGLKMRNFIEARLREVDVLITLYDEES